ncbi:MAG: RidA family protein [Gemmatimonadetes bacterium]|nr:RidA family protein [Gemmatimonadota bacterium]MDA1103307.1 RidA family protein [Gemmatimonadota bacterium]
MTFERINPEALGPPRGWTNGMLGPAGGRVLFIAGQDAANADGVVTTDDFVEQFDIVLGKMMSVVREAGGDAGSIGRITLFVTDLDAYRAARKEIGEVYRAHMGRHFPAMALAEVSRLVDPRGRVEIEATAVIAADAP